MSLYRFAGFEFDAERGLLIRDGNEQNVRHKVARLIAYLITHRERVVSKEELLQQLWDHGEYRENSLTQSVREARRLLGDSAQQPTFIRNFPQRGYQWITVTEVVLPKSLETEHEVGPEPAQLDDTPVATEQPLPGKALPEKQPIAGTFRRYQIVLVLLAALLITFILFRPVTDNQPASETAADKPSQQRLMVLPFINETGDPSLQWMEMGLSDMLATSLAQGSQRAITAPAASHNLLAVEGLAWPPEPESLQALMRQQKIDLLLYSRVSLYRDQQVLNIRLYRSDGTVTQGSISYPQLAIATSAVAAQLKQLIDPHPGTGELPQMAAHPASVQDLVRGLQALQQQGAALADNYFSAALLQDPGNRWAQAYSAKTSLQLGRWQQASSRLSEIDSSGDTALANFICRWQGEIAYRQGSLDSAHQQLTACAVLAENSHDRRIEYESYRLLAQIAHQQYNWSEFRRWNRLAAGLSDADGGLEVQAERLFYLGNPVESGLEKDPYNDLLQNGPRLKQALLYFQSLANQPRIAATRFALAQNYTLPLSERESALKEAVMLWRSLKMPFELAQALTYEGFYRLQLHQGERAIEPLEEAIRLTEQLGAQWLQEQARFYRAFADLDIGLARGGDPDPSALQRSVQGFDRLLAEGTLPQKEQADARVLSGWALAELGQLEEARQRQQQARTFYRDNQMDISFGYTLYSQMWIALLQNNLEEVVRLGREPVQTRLQLRYLAEAYHRLARYEDAAETFAAIATKFSESWTDDDRQILKQYRLNPTQGLGILPSAHLVYCESDWQVETALLPVSQIK
ncbi:winged helix-turn-helix domain-containing protein [Marinobacterium jannaschii]|uniref:winged helix-turn-helix domain-containing protein n=1 Tax=Marinobacterium jannaschii TaxID=64970 RepID=UPI000480EA2F|nr:winged helix-turn-helix domain-containing protein [Marinobacterium jannaschii]